MIRSIKILKKKIFWLVILIILIVLTIEKHKIKKNYLQLVEQYKYLKVKYTKNNYYIKKSENIYLLDNKKIKVSKYFSPLVAIIDKGIFLSTRQFIQFYKEKLFLVTGNGNIYVTSSHIENSSKIKLKKINSNLEKLIGKEFLKEYPNNIMHFLIEDEKMYMSYLKKESKECYFSEILVADLNVDFIEFKKKIFSLDECNDVPGNPGGRLVSLNENELLYTVGDAAKKHKPQDMKSFYGKILKINKKNGETKIFSLGHRNPEGLFNFKEKNIILSTDHGPVGGDEVNFQIIKENKVINYGWPIASYGYHSTKNEEIKKKYPFYKSHFKYNFNEPLFHANEISIPPTQIIVANNFIKIKNNDVLYFGSLGWDVRDRQRSIHQLIVNEDDFKVYAHNIIPVDERIRDLAWDYNNNKIYFTFINGIGIVELN
jgi:hypothetical protein